jgi:hypothetical protein
MQKMKENLISFRNIFLKNKKRVNLLNNIVKTKKRLISSGETRSKFLRAQNFSKTHDGGCNNHK